MKQDLWRRISDYHFDNVVPPQLSDHVSALFGGPDASTKAFASKLSRKLGWPMSLALRAIHEYKKFVYLGNVGSNSVTPSKIIDQVWHEHILFSKAYREFCRDVLGRDFDHNPELVPTTGQTDVFQTQYQETLEAYRNEFNMEPPAIIWAVPKFAPAVENVGKGKPKKAKRSRPDRWNDDTPLYVYFDGGSVSESGSDSDLGFGGGGEFSGAGASRDWTSDDSSSSSDSGDSGSSGDSGGSGCSSSCGGGGCSSD